MVGGYPVGARPVAASRLVIATAANAAAVATTEAVDALAALAGPVNAADVAATEASDVAAIGAGPLELPLVGKLVRRSKRRRVHDDAPQEALGTPQTVARADVPQIAVVAPVAASAPVLRPVEPVAPGPYDKAIAAMLADARRAAAEMVKRRDDLTFETALADVLAEIDDDETAMLLLLA